MGTRATVEPPRRGFCSSMFLVLRPQVNLRSPASLPEAEEAEGEQPKVADLLQKI
jgi:hypothetical protein